MGLRVLVVDDSSVMRKILQRTLRATSTIDIDSLSEASDGADAMTKLDSEGPFNVVFSDINMPNVNGIDFLKQLSASPHKTTPVIMVTTEGGERTVMEAIQLGAKGFIRKPFTPDQIGASLAKIV